MVANNSLDGWMDTGTYTTVMLYGIEQSHSEV